MMRWNCAISAGSRSEAASSRVSTDPLMVLSGVLSSWLTMPRNSDRSRSNSSRGVMSCRVTTTDSISPSSERMGVALTRVVIDRPPGTSMTISSARTVSPRLSAWARGNSCKEIARPSARRKVSSPRRSSAVRSGPCRSSTILLASWLTDFTAAVFASNTRTPTGAVFTRASRSALARCSSRCLRALAMTSAAWDANMTSVSSSSRVNSRPASFSRDIDVADALAPVEDRRCQKGHGRAYRQRREEIGKAKRPDVAEQVREAERFRNPIEVLKEPHPVRQVPQLSGLLGGHPGGEEVLYPSRIVEERNHTVACAGQGPGTVQDTLQHRLEVEALIDAKAGLAQPGEAVPQGRYLPFTLFGAVHVPNLYSVWTIREALRPATAGRGTGFGGTRPIIAVERQHYTDIQSISACITRSI